MMKMKSDSKEHFVAIFPADNNTTACQNSALIDTISRNKETGRWQRFKMPHASRIISDLQT
jgi:hypothetical protein